MRMPLDILNEKDVIREILGALGAGRGGVVVTANVEILRQHHRDARLHGFFEASDLVVPDGMPLVWASRLQGTPNTDRVAGSALIWSLSSAAATDGASVFLVGGDPGVAEKAARQLSAASPNLRVAGTACPLLTGDGLPAELARLRPILRDAAPDILFIGLPFEKQVHVMTELRDLLPQAWFVGVGVALSYVSGDLPRAPDWMQRLGLEWLHRLRYEPRLYRRYLLNGPPIVGRLALHVLRVRLRKREPG